VILKDKNLLALVSLVVIALITVCGCASNSSTPSAQAPQSLKKFTTEDLKKLRWLEGTWRGTGGDVQPFFERYRFENDSTLVIESAENEKFEKITDTTRYELKDGEFGGGNEGFRWIASEIDDKSVTFVPVVKARNSFRWETVSKDEWKAVLNWPATADKPSRERVYKIERLR
jgi:PKD repeat protein